mmetsp:Transcript_5184/g.7291  ORF Transcript_5184/g.7291 Transcript_5184/m.7291 type:complete len:213 (+) Transcript_5184:44-682(+)|eukprot:CAMPEP_0197296330 /NCGR_PEP_ID=MMETSP0890-20130614/38056_1 /TAXON_ID=44058 ORGANISM="Aureoumbra lagunensis, Strain CCMP1510" /NCGR_SAMPLE_ID=MMETSP0890 /ASSEMBLY_ACC=CAM_ASM_000533 /LENGTH=212 /DNA_ID=CAMNT_0042772809 /DNA_START=32 /DNA_END=673 /DNA_ORIENTATION=-
MLQRNIQVMVYLILSGMVTGLDVSSVNRRTLIRGSVLSSLFSLSEARAESVILKNGLRYIDQTEGSGEMPRWGQLLKIAYSISVESSNDSPIKIDERKEYLVHHGNGRTIRGLDEGLHTMRIGGKRRIEVPNQNLGYVTPGLGPLPESAATRRTFNKALSKLDATVVFDVALLDAFDDDADLGYYVDNSFTGKQLAGIIEKSQRVANSLPQQ